MRTIKTILALGLVIGSCVIYSMVWAQTPDTKPEQAKLRVGTFDSRAIALAYARTEEFNRGVKQLMEEGKKAKAEGNAKKLKELEAKGKAGQQKLHMQGFSTASVNEYLAHIKDQIPAVAKEAGVDVIVSKWDVVYQSPSAEFVDVTNLMVKPFHPNETTLKTIEELKKHKPISLDEAENIND
jgi:Skp family chaperone for outer membrane proteins